MSKSRYFFVGSGLTLRITSVLYSLCALAMFLFASGFAYSQPSVISTSPGQNELNVSISSSISATFSTDMDPSSMNDTTLVVFGNYSGCLEGSISYDSASRTVIFHPENGFSVGEIITAVLTAKIHSLQNSNLEKGFAWSFTAEVSGGHRTFGYSIAYMETDSMFLYDQLMPSAVASDFDNDGDVDLAAPARFWNDHFHQNAYYISIFTNLRSYGMGIIHGEWYFMDFDVENYLLSCSDFDNNGIQDLAVIEDAAYSHSLSIGYGGQGYDFSYREDHALDTSITSCTPADFNLDGRIDVALADPDSSAIIIFTNLGDSAFSEGVSYAANISTQALSAADMDNDGAFDLIAGYIDSTGSNFLTVYFNNGNGEFDSLLFIEVSGEIKYALPNDFNGDGQLDIAYIEKSSNHVFVVLNSGNCTFGELPNAYVTSSVPSSLFAGDIDDNGSLDLIAGETVLFNNGTGAFLDAVDLSGRALKPGRGRDLPSISAVADFDGDGDLDIASLGTIYGPLEVAVNWNMDYPKIVSAAPAMNAINIPKDAIVAVSFDVNMVPQSLNDSTFFVYGKMWGRYDGTIRYDSLNRTFTFTPTTNFMPGERVTVTLTDSIRSIFGFHLEAGYSWSFTVRTYFGSAHFYVDSSYRLDNYYRLDGASESISLDINRDNKLDIAYVRCYHWEISPGHGQEHSAIFLLKNENSNVFTADSLLFVDGGPLFSRIEGADIDKDGDMDMLLTGLWTYDIDAFLNDNDSIYSWAEIGDLWTADIAAADIDNDGDYDIATSEFIMIWNNGFGEWDIDSTNKPIISGGSAFVMTEDLDGNGRIEVTGAVYDGSSNEYSLLGMKIGQARDIIVDTLYISHSRIVSAYLQDFDGNGYIDIAIGVDGQGTQILLNDGTGRFVVGGLYTTPILDIEGGDFDGDGDIDLAFPKLDSITIMINQGDGTFADMNSFYSGGKLESICTGDYDGDGDLDIAGNHYYPSIVTIMLNESTLSKIRIIPADTSIRLGDTVWLRAVGDFVDHTTKDITDLCTWQSVDSSVVEVKASGVCIGSSPGRCIISTTLMNLSDEINIDVVNAINGIMNPANHPEEIDCSLFVFVSGNPERVDLLYRAGGAYVWDTIHMEMTDTLYMGIIPSESIGVRGIEYYFRTVENNVSGTLPWYKPEVSPLRVQIQLNNHLGPVLPDGLFRMIGFPYELDPENDSFDSVFFDDLGPPSDTVWKIARWDPERADYLKNDKVGAINIGQGYWIWTAGANRVGADGASSLPDIFNDTLSMWYDSIVLEPGWNQISSPFAFPVDWSDVRKDPGVGTDARAFIAWHGGKTAEYGYAQSLEPYVGYWIENGSSSTKRILIPYSEGENKSITRFPHRIDQSDWYAVLEVESESEVDLNNIVGTASATTEAVDSFDISEPPTLEQGIFLAFKNRTIEGQEKLLSGDFRPNNESGQKYKILLRGYQNKPATIAVTQTHNLPDDYMVALYDSSSGYLYELSPNKPLSVPDIPTPEGIIYDLLIGPPSYVIANGAVISQMPSTYRLYQNFPNPFNDATRIRFDLPIPGKVLITIRNVLGQKVVDLIDQNMAAGEHEVIWSGIDGSGNKIASGIYFYRIESQNFSDCRKMLLLK